MSAVEENNPSFSTRQWLVVGLLVLSVVINYVDRSNLAIAAPLLAPQLSLSPLQMGSLLAAFSWTYAFLQLFGISGWFADRFPVGYVFLIGYILWSVATLATGFLNTFTAIFAARLLLGAGESIAYPCYSRVFAELPQHQRGRANSFIDAGTKLGPSAGALLGGVLMIHFGWRSLFLVLGFGGLLWIIPWLAVMPRTGTAPTKPSAEASTFEILSLRSAWGTFLGHFCGNYFYYSLLTWSPIYLVKEVHLSLTAMARFTSAAFLLIALTTVAVGWLTDRLIASGVSPTKVRKSAVTAGLASASLLGLIAFTPVGSRFSLVVFIVACAGFGAYAGNHWAISQTLAGPTMAGRWTGLQNGIANLSGIVGPTLAGAIVQHFGGLRFAFLITGIIALLGALCWAFLVGRVEPVEWSSQRIPSQTP
jgi:ACS family D-galactonate transporter-like MFS transporter